MGKGISIEWTDHSWPVVNGCRRVSAGCENCYAERLTATRLSKTPKYEGLATIGKNGPRWTGESRLWMPHLRLPLTIRKPSRIFVADMGDLFFDGVADEDIALVFGVMAACPQHTFQVLTKRPQRMKKWFRWAQEYFGDAVNAPALAKALGLDVAVGDKQETWRRLRQLPLSNVWIGVSVEDQTTADERIPLLLETPAALRFVSYEPALGPVDFERVQWPGQHRVDVLRGGAWYYGGFPGFTKHSDMQTLNWIIVGGESGPGARPFDLEWARSAVRQCREAGVACFVKQLGARPIWGQKRAAGGQPDRCHLNDRKGGDMEEWPEGLRVREFPDDRGEQSPPRTTRFTDESGDSPNACDDLRYVEK